MTDIEISKALALAIGHEEQHTLMHLWLKHLNVFDCATESWKDFDYRDWNVIGPIAQRYNLFPCLNAWGMWDSTSTLNTQGEYQADTPQKAIAFAVIGAKK